LTRGCNPPSIKFIKFAITYTDGELTHHRHEAPRKKEVVKMVSEFERVFRKLEKNLEFTEAGQTEDRVFFMSRGRECAMSFPKQLFLEQVNIDFSEYDKIDDTMVKKLSEWREQGDTYIYDAEGFRCFVDFLNKNGVDKIKIYHDERGLVFEYTGDSIHFDDICILLAIGDNLFIEKYYNKYNVEKISRFIKSFKVSDLRPYELLIRFPELSEDAHALVLQLKLLEHIHCDFILAPIVEPPM